MDFLVPLKGPKWLSEHHILLKIVEAFALSLMASKASWQLLLVTTLILFALTFFLKAGIKERVLVFVYFLSVIVSMVFFVWLMAKDFGENYEGLIGAVLQGGRFAVMALGTYILYRSTPLSRLGGEIAGLGRLIRVPLVSLGIMVQLVFLFVPELLAIFYRRLTALKNREVGSFMRIVYVLVHMMDVMDELIDRRVIALQNRIAFERFGRLSPLGLHDVPLMLLYSGIFTLSYFL